MNRKKVVSGPIHGTLTEVYVDLGKGRGVPRASLMGKVVAQPTQDGGFPVQSGSTVSSPAAKKLT